MERRPRLALRGVDTRGRPQNGFQRFLGGPGEAAIAPPRAIR
jgi:hypothetical protein